MTDSQKLDLILDGIKGVEIRLREEMHGLNSELREEMHGLNSELREEMHELKNELREEMHELKNELREEIENLKEDNKAIKLLLENEICVNIKRIAEGHLDLARNLKEAQIPSQEYEVLTLRVNTLEREVGEIKKKIS